MIFQFFKIFSSGAMRATHGSMTCCALILAFVFLTPRNWFDNGELTNRAGHQNPVAQTRLLISAETLPVQADTATIEQRAAIDESPGFENRKCAFP
jgi:hypothetical protein